MFPRWIPARLKIQHKKTAVIGAATLESRVVNISFGAEAYCRNRDNFKTLVNKASKQCVQAQYKTELLKHSGLPTSQSCNSK